VNPLLRRRLLRTGALGAFAVGASSAFVLWEDPGREEPPEVLRLSSPVPQFSLPALRGAAVGGAPVGDVTVGDTEAAGGEGFGSGDLAGQPKPVLINFFASWCAPCAREAPVLLALRDQGVTIWGVAYKDKPDAARAFLQQHGNPYARVARDDSGSAGAEFGLLGVPESFLIDPLGIVRWHWTGGLSEDTVRRSLAPRLKAVS
jgi:cytochrome c biogenesis protein CcmG, thiol:disulfide interchange protein DsbE